MKWFKKRRQNDKQPQPFPERPADWNLTLADLMQEMQAGQRQSVGQPEIDWARDYERSLISDQVRFPKQGDLYESLEDQKIQYLTAWAVPFTGGGEATLLVGEQIWIHAEPSDEKPIGSYALPVNYELLEKRMVPQAERQDPKYGGFYFYVQTVVLSQKFKLIQSDYQPGGENAIAP